MRIPVEKNNNNKSDIKINPRGIYELGGFGALVELYPVRRQIVKHAITGELMDKMDAYICARKEFDWFFYLRKGEKKADFDENMMKPSHFEYE